MSYPDFPSRHLSGKMPAYEAGETHEEQPRNPGDDAPRTASAALALIGYFSPGGSSPARNGSRSARHVARHPRFQATSIADLAWSGLPCIASDIARSEYSPK